MAEQAVHILVDGFTTACGLSRHFSASVAPEIAVKIEHVTCNKCKMSKEYHEWKEALINEGIYKDNEDT